jgi:sigma-E processing peptidase SpoIIGA
VIQIIEIYADVLYFLLFVADYILLKLVSVIMKKKEKELRIFAGACVGSILSFGLLMFYGCRSVWIFVFLFVVGGIMLKISFTIRDKTEFIRCLFLLFLCAYCMGGAYGFLSRNELFRRFRYTGIFFAGALIFIYLFVRKGFDMMKDFLLHRSQNAEVCLKVQGKKAYCKGFWDSGNSLRDPITGKAVVLLEKGILEKYQIPIPVKGFRVIPFHSVGMENGVLKGFVADELLVKDEKGYERSFQKTIVAIYEGKLSIKEDYQMILSPHL